MPDPAADAGSATRLEGATHGATRPDDSPIVDEPTDEVVGGLEGHGDGGGGDAALVPLHSSDGAIVAAASQAGDLQSILRLAERVMRPTMHHTVPDLLDAIGRALDEDLEFQQAFQSLLMEASQQAASSTTNLPPPPPLPSLPPPPPSPSPPPLRTTLSLSELPAGMQPPPPLASAPPAAFPEDSGGAQQQQQHTQQQHQQQRRRPQATDEHLVTAVALYLCDRDDAHTETRSFGGTQRAARRNFVQRALAGFGHLVKPVGRLLKSGGHGLLGLVALLQRLAAEAASKASGSPEEGSAGEAQKKRFMLVLAVIMVLHTNPALGKALAAAVTLEARQEVRREVRGVIRGVIDYLRGHLFNSAAGSRRV